MRGNAGKLMASSWIASYELSLGNLEIEKVLSQDLNMNRLENYSYMGVVFAQW